MIYVDENRGPMVMESLIESGVGITPLKEWRKHHHVRTVLYRPRNHELAEKAAANLYRVIRERQENKQPIPYDFTMKADEHSEIFCAEIISWAFDMVMEGKSNIPAYPTEFLQFLHHSFLKTLTVNEKSTFSPNDLEVEPSVEMVAEWRNYEGTRMRRIQDVVLTSMMKWMAEDNYILKGSWRSFSMTNIAWMGRKLFGFKKDQIPPNMPKGFLKTFIRLEKVSQILENYLSDIENEYFERTGYSMDYSTMLNVMESLRKKDCARFVKRDKEWEENFQAGDYSPITTDKPLFHNIFNTKRGVDCQKY
jgi:hypothetical protein